jgi:hypothetical protein
MGCHEVENVKKFKTDHIINNHVDAKDNKASK